MLMGMTQELTLRANTVTLSFWQQRRLAVLFQAFYGAWLSAVIILRSRLDIPLPDRCQC